MWKVEREGKGRKREKEGEGIFSVFNYLKHENGSRLVLLGHRSQNLEE